MERIPKIEINQPDKITIKGRNKITIIERIKR